MPNEGNSFTHYVISNGVLFGEACIIEKCNEWISLAFSKLGIGRPEAVSDVPSLRTTPSFPKPRTDSLGPPPTSSKTHQYILPLLRGGRRARTPPTAQPPKLNMLKVPIEVLDFLEVDPMLPEPSFPANPADFIGRAHEIESFKAALRQSVFTKRMPSFAVLGNWGIGKSSLLFKLAYCCRQIDPAVLPVHLSISQDIEDYLRFAESLCDKLADALASSESLVARLRVEARNWKFKQFKAGPITAERELPRRFLTSGSALLRHSLAEAWDHFIRPAQLAGAVFFLDDLQNLSLASGDAALIIRDQFQVFAVEGMNFSVCFSAKPDYFSPVRSFAEPAVRFYNKLILGPFTFGETSEYAKAVFEREGNIEFLAPWLYEKTLGHPYFLAFICRELLARGIDSPAKLWPEISAQLEREKFQSDLAQLSDKDVSLLRTLAAAEQDEVSPTPFAKQFQHEYFGRLTDRGLLIRAGRGRYKLYHPLFREFLRQTQ